MNIRIEDPVSRCDEAAVYYEEAVSRTMEALVQSRNVAQEEMRALFGDFYEVDEMALLFRSPETLRYWVEAAVRIPGVVLFNTSHDAVTTTPIQGQYDVHYWFLSVPEEYGGWRIEAMYAHPGSPLHTTLALKMKEADVTVVHASFKCVDEEMYGIAVNTLSRNGFDLAQKCQSTYGRFSYWGNEEKELGGVFLKPRVNLRDMEVTSE